MHGDPFTSEKPKWNPRTKSLNFHIWSACEFFFVFLVFGSDGELIVACKAQIRAVKEALHIGMASSYGLVLVCQEDEQN
jgi:hypothetical protein